MKAQIIEKDSEPEWAVVPYAEYLRLVEAREMLDDINAYDEAMAADEEETLPHEMVRRLVEGEPPVRVWREHRGMTQRELAERIGIQKAYLSQIESGRRMGSVKVLANLAETLEVAIEDLLEDPPKIG